VQKLLDIFAGFGVEAPPVADLDGQALIWSPIPSPISPLASAPAR
jgi:hypothetical protein